MSKTQAFLIIPYYLVSSYFYNDLLSPNYTAYVCGRSGLALDSDSYGVFVVFIFYGILKIFHEYKEKKIVY